MAKQLSTKCQLLWVIIFITFSSQTLALVADEGDSRVVSNDSSVSKDDLSLNQKYISKKLNEFQDESIDTEMKIKSIEQKIRLDKLKLEAKKLSAQLDALSQKKYQNIEKVIPNKTANIVRQIDPIEIREEVVLSSIYIIDGKTYADFINEKSGDFYRAIVPGRVFGRGFSYNVSSSGRVMLRYKK
ncbi:hypothetical protein [Vibrio mediterranei]|uniref:Uncharacterized protein n=1 Tax=Vibrio mediterranei TaxID=689 RepID=A0A3G4V978_9VIBR|nr:hypothetical protein [Vibrio mediterranei]AYV21015.1 hypothetical protein ECB94_06680 [Vibrio mediterranei]